MYCAHTELEFVAHPRNRRYVCKRAGIARRHPITGQDLVGKNLQLLDQHRGLDGVEPAGDADARGLGAVDALAMQAQALHPRRQGIVIGEHGAAIAIAAKRLRRKKAGCGRRRHRAELFAAIARAETLRRIVEHQKPVRRGDRADGVVIGRQPEQVDRNDRARLKPALAGRGDRALTACRIEVEGLWRDIGDDRRGTQQRHHLGGGVIGEGRANHRIAAPDLPRHKHEQERVGAAGAADRMTDAGKGGKPGFEFAHLRTLDKLAVRQNARHRVINRTAKPTALGRDVDERDRLVVHTNMLIHGRSWLLFVAIPVGTTVTRQPTTRRGPFRCGTEDEAERVLRQRMAISRLATASSPVTGGDWPVRIALTKAASSERSGSA